MEAFKRFLFSRRLGHWLARLLENARVYSEIDVRIARGGSGLHGLRIAYISDTHAGSFMHESDLCRVFERIARAEPDLVCLGGDLIEDRAEQALLLGKAISLLRPPLGIFAVPGNHEHESDPGLEVWSAVLRECGVTLLINRGQRIQRGGESLWLAGVDDFGLGQPDLGAALEGADEDEPVLLLSHNPDLFIEASHIGVDLTLSGHTHGGQITIFGWTPLKHSRLGYWRGHYEREGAQLYVGSGVGVTGLPLRVHAPGEVPVLRLCTRD